MTPAQNLQRHPALCREAERLAKEHWGAVRVALENWNRIEPGKWTWDDIDPLERRFNIDAQARLLADLSRPESRDWLVRSGAEADGRWGVEKEHPVLHLDPFYRATFVGVLLKNRMGFNDMADAERDVSMARSANWHALRDDPERLVAEWLAVSS